MRILRWSELDKPARAAALKRPARRADLALVETVARIVTDIESKGEPALIEWATRLDGAPPQAFTLTAGVVDRARASLAREDLDALVVAVENISAYHQATRPADAKVTSVAGGECRRAFRPIRACGLYAPGGSAPLFSTLLMLALPAAAAGVPVRVAVTPPSRAGAVNPMMIAAAAACDLDALYLVGGAQAIAALACGVFLPQADKICGPGNAYVAEAKRLVSARGLAAIDLPAGPSELFIIADETADPATVAADLLGQAEHDAEAQLILAVTTERLAQAISVEIERQISALPRRTIAAAALDHSRIFLVRDADDAIAIADAYAPEHLAIHAAGADEIADRITNAGAIFVGGASAEVFSDYLAGPSHVLPTDGAARAFSGVTTATFMKSVSIQKFSPETARRLAPAAARLARLEGLEAHALSAERRL